MDKKLIVTAAGPAMRPLLEQYSLPTFERYAEIFGYDVRVEAIDADAAKHTDAQHKAARFAKLGIVRRALETDAELVVWLDADAMICRYDQDIADGVSADCFQGLCLDWVPTGRRINPNTGVWAMRGTEQTFDFLDEVGRLTPQPGPWADQASVMKALGWLWDTDHDYAGARPGGLSRFLAGTSWLGEGWNQPDFSSENCHVGWEGRPSVPNPHIVHFMGMYIPERRAKMAALSERLAAGEGAVTPLYQPHSELEKTEEAVS